MIAMKAMAVTQGGRPVAPNVELIEVESPVAAAGEILVRTEAAALNHLDLWVGMGIPGVERPWPRITGSDGVGIVEAVGSGVDEVWIGRRVIMNAAIEVTTAHHPEIDPAGEHLSMIGEHIAGAMAQQFVVPVSNVLDIGDADPNTAAAFGLAHLTAWRMIRTRARLRTGEWVLIPGIGGGVATAALGIVKHLGGRAIVTSRHQSKLDRAIELGADAAVLDEGTDWSREVRGITGRRGVDVCIDSVGRAVHLACLKSLARSGRLVTCGCTSGSDPETDLTRIFWNQLSIMGSTMGDMAEFREVVHLFRTGRLSPVVDGVYPWTDGLVAWERLESGAQCGKLVIDWTA